MTPAPLPPIDKVPLDPNGRFVHFIEHDAALWKRFLENHRPDDALAVAYDVHVGTPAPTPPGIPANYRRMIGHLSSKRIDAILFFPNETAIIEVKPYAGVTAIGQTLSYVQLFRARFPDAPRPFPSILTDTAQPDVPQLCSQFNIILVELDYLDAPEE